MEVPPLMDYDHHRYVFFAEGKKILSQLPALDKGDYEDFVKSHPHLRLPPDPESYYLSQEYRDRTLMAAQELSQIFFIECGITWDVFLCLEKACDQQDLLPLYRLRKYFSDECFFSEKQLTELRTKSLLLQKEDILETLLDPATLEKSMRHVLFNEFSYMDDIYVKVVNSQAFLMFGF